MKKYLIISTLALSLSIITQAQYLLAGTYTNNGSASKGIYLYRFHISTADSKEITNTKTENPSFQVISRDGRFIYSVEETAQGKVSSHYFDRKNGIMKAINQQPSNGDDPCYIELDKTGKWLFCGNYSSGTLSVYPVLKNGSIGTTQQVISHSGSGPNKDRQTSPHVHCTYMSPNNKYLYVVDLGIDKVMIYPFNEKTGRLDEAKSSSVAINAGGGPRHITFDKNGKFAYLIEELSGAVVAYKVEGNNLSQIQRENHLKAGEQGAGADIHLSPDGKFLYVSQRSDNTIQAFRINGSSGLFSYITSYSTTGKRPRNFTIHPSGKFLLVANQDTDDIVIFNRNITTGKLQDSGKIIHIGKPVCLKWIE